MNKKQLKKILDNHKKWLKDKSGQCANLRDANLKDANLKGVNLRSADLKGADLRGANLTYADLRDANLRSADLRYTDLRNTDLRSANLIDANLDFSVLPLWCGGLNWKVDKNIFTQIMYHIDTFECKDKDIQKLKKMKIWRKLVDKAEVIKRHNLLG